MTEWRWRTCTANPVPAGPARHRGVRHTATLTARRDPSTDSAPSCPTELVTEPVTVGLRTGIITYYAVEVIGNVYSGFRLQTARLRQA